MLCARCGQLTPTAPCEACGGDPALAGRYFLEELLARVTVGRTWRATRVEDGQPVALTCVGAPEGLEGETGQRFKEGISVAQRMRHRDIPRLLEGFEASLTGGLCLCAVQEWVEGEPLSRKLRVHEEDEALAVLEAVLPAIAYVHGLSPPVVHGDVCLANLLRRSDGGVSLVGFGAGVAARALADPLPSDWPYTAPEVTTQGAGPASDLYSLGVVLLALLQGREPEPTGFGTPVVTWRRQVEVRPVTALLLEQLLELDPAIRQRSITQTLALVRGARAGSRAQEDLERRARENAGVLPKAGTPPPSEQRVSEAEFLEPLEPDTDELLRPYRARQRWAWVGLVALAIAVAVAAVVALL